MSETRPQYCQRRTDHETCRYCYSMAPWFDECPAQHKHAKMISTEDILTEADLKSLAKAWGCTQIDKDTVQFSDVGTWKREGDYWRFWQRYVKESPKMRLQFTEAWLKEKIASEPDDTSCEAGIAHNPMTLSERLRSGKGADRELEFDIARALGWTNRPLRPPPWLTDLNAVFALVERELPEWAARSDETAKQDEYCATLYHRNSERYRYGVGNDRCRALLLALLAVREGK